MKQNWNKLEQIFPPTKEGTILLAEFEYLGSKKILDIQSSCNCTNFTLDDNTLYVNWKTPVRYRERDSQTFISVEYEDGTIDDLTLKTYLEV